MLGPWLPACAGTNGKDSQRILAKQKPKPIQLLRHSFSSAGSAACTLCAQRGGSHNPALSTRPPMFNCANDDPFKSNVPGRTPMAQLTLTIDGKARTIEVDDPDMPLLYALRDELGFNNPRFGCGLGQCGACTVQIDGRAVRSCITPVSRARAAARSPRSPASARPRSRIRSRRPGSRSRSTSAATASTAGS